jgi:hypothetical protein
MQPICATVMGQFLQISGDSFRYRHGKNAWMHFPTILWNYLQILPCSLFFVLLESSRWVSTSILIRPIIWAGQILLDADGCVYMIWLGYYVRMSTSADFCYFMMPLVAWQRSILQSQWVYYPTNKRFADSLIVFQTSITLQF